MPASWSPESKGEAWASKRLKNERLGTKHRAAVGLSLASDALVVVVSEETGSISVIEEGKITRNLDGDGLRRRVSPKVSRGNGFFK
jgi:diadenylate cyclase